MGPTDLSTTPGLNMAKTGNRLTLTQPHMYEPDEDDAEHKPEPENPHSLVAASQWYCEIGNQAFLTKVNQRE